MSEPETFGSMLLHLRLEKGLSQSALASAMGVDHTYISHLEHDRRIPSVQMLVLLATVLDVSAVNLFEVLVDTPITIARGNSEKPADEWAIPNGIVGILSEFRDSWHRHDDPAIPICDAAERIQALYRSRPTTTVDVGLLQEIGVIHRKGKS